MLISLFLDGIDGRRGSVNVVETAVGGTLPTPPLSSTATTTTTTEKPSVKLHNKVEKRYRYNVKNALETLRDAVPRLRQVYKTSLPLELATTDVEDAQGLMGGLERLGKPTKKTVMYGARLYIEYLETEQRVAQVRVKRGEEVVRQFFGGDEEGWARWVDGTEEVVGRVRRDYVALLEEKARVRAEASGMDDGVAGPQQVKVEQDDDEEEEEEEEERPKKRTKKQLLAAAAGDSVEGKPSGGKIRKNAAGSTTTATGKRKSRAAGAATTTTTTTAVSAFYSFGLAYMVFPRATSLFGSTTAGTYAQNTSSSSHSGGSGSSGTGGKVLLAAAKSAEDLGRRALPPHRAPTGDTILDGVWFVLLGLAMTVFALWIAQRGRARVAGREKVVGFGEGDDEAEDVEGDDAEGREKWEHLAAELGVGTVSGMVDEISARIPMVGRPLRVSQNWYRLLSAFVGGGEFLVDVRRRLRS